MKYLSDIFKKIPACSKRLLSLFIVFIFLYQVLGSQPLVFADDPCTAADAQTQQTTGALSDCQRQLYQEGILGFDLAAGAASQTCVVQTSAEFSGSDGAQSLYNYLIGQSINSDIGNGHLTPLQVAAIMGNIQVESNFDPTALNSIGAFGIVQWLGGRYNNLVDYAKSQGKPKDDFGVQSQFLWVELTGAYKDSTLTPLSQSNDIAEATKIVDDHYEVSGGASIDKRTADAQAILDQYGGGAGGTSDAVTTNVVATANTSGGCDTTNAGEDTQYVDGFTVYSQYDPAWKDNKYGTSNIGDSGCAPSAMAMIVTALTGKKVTPADTTVYANSQNLYVPHAGSSWTIAPVLAKHYGLSATAIGADAQKIAATLQAGGLVIGSGDGSLPFTSSGHYIVIRGVTSDGKWLVGDSAHKETNSEPFDPQTILTQMHDGSVYAITKGDVSV